MSHTDHAGYPVTASQTSTVERYDAAVGSLLRFSDDIVGAWDAAVADEPDFALGQIGRAYLRCLSSEGADAAHAATILGDLGEGDDLTDRERRHLDAARAHAAGDLHGASERLALLSVEYPRDALALAVGHQLDFFRGDALGLRDRIGRALLAWDPGDARYGFVLGMQSFGFEECNQYPQAEAAGMEALDREPRDVWALHAVVHVHEMGGLVHEGLRFMDERRADWAGGNFFVVHNSWHEALFFLELGEIERALQIYDATLHHAESENVALEMLDAAALLWRIHLDSGDVGGRWGPLADAWGEKLDEPWYVFNDMHATMALVGADRLGDARAVVDRLTAYVAGPPSSSAANAEMTTEVGLPVCQAVLAFGEGRYADAVALLHPIRRNVHRFGGSHAQRDAVARTLLEAAVRGGDTALARALVSERLAVKDASPYAWGQLARIEREGGDETAAAVAETRVTQLRASA